MDKVKNPKHILDIVDIDNMVPELDEHVLTQIGADVVEQYGVDKDSMSTWLERNDLAMNLIDMSPQDVTDPWPGAAGTKLPLVLNAAMKASAEEYAEITRGNELVKAQIFGKKTPEKLERSERVRKRMNHQFYHELEDWEEEHDKLILAKNILGTVHKKIFYAEGKCQCALRRTGVVINDGVERIQDAPRITDEIDKFWWQVKEKFNAGEWEEIEFSESSDSEFAKSDKETRFLEQITQLDLDGDDYPEPYIVTVHEKTKQVVRIEPNFTPESIQFSEDIDVLEYEELTDEEKSILKRKLDVIRIDRTISRVRYAKYAMIHSWEGGYWDYGYGILLGPLNENCNELVNTLLNSGHLANKGGGFYGSGIKMAGGELRFKQNEWKKVPMMGGRIQDHIMPLPVKEPSQTLFSLLGLLMDVLRELSSVTEVMSGDQPKANMPAASIDMLIEQGKKMFNSVYKRHFRAFTKEQQAVFDLNYLYQDPLKYAELLDLELPEEELLPLVKADFTREGIDILPTANPEFSSKVQRMAQARALLELAGDPEINVSIVKRMYVEAIVDDSELAAEIVPEQPNMTPAQVQEQMEMQKQEMMNELDVQEKQAKAKTAESQAQEAAIALQMKQLEAQALGIKLPAAIKKDELGVEKAELGVQKDRLSVQKEAIAVENERVKGVTERIKGINERNKPEVASEGSKSSQ
jgi:hypothetical protein